MATKPVAHTRARRKQPALRPPQHFNRALTIGIAVEIVLGVMQNVSESARERFMSKLIKLASETLAHDRGAK